MPIAGTQQIMAVDINPQNLNFGNSGSNQVYDFSQLHQNKIDTVFYTSLDSMQLLSFPHANIAVTHDHINYEFVKSDSLGFNIIGAYDTILGLDTAYPFSSTAGGLIFPVSYDSALNGSYLASVSANGPRFTPPSTAYILRVRIRNSFNQMIDGWGTLKTPTCNYKCLRMKRMEYDTSYLDLKTSLTSYNGLDTFITARTMYYYLTQTHGSVLQIEYDNFGNPISVAWSLDTPPAIYPTFTDTNTIGGIVEFTNTTVNNGFLLTWTFGDSSTSSLLNPTHVYTADSSYMVCLTESNCTTPYTYCDTVVVSDLTNGIIYPPEAGVDTASVIQKGAVSIFALANDVDPNNLPLCIDSVWGSSRGLAIKQNCDTIIYQETDTNYIGFDTVYYQLCDNEAIPLCDTGVLIINIEPILPIARISPPSVGSYSNEYPLAFFCAKYGFLRDSSLYYSLDSPTIWTMRIIGQWGGYGFGDSITLYGDSSMLMYPSYFPFVFGNPSLYICLTVKNKYGSNTVCDSFSTDCEGIEEVPRTDFKMYPSPTNDILTIEFTGGYYSLIEGKSEIEIYSTVGEKLKTITVQNSNMSIHLGDLTAGVYFIAIKISGQNKQVLGKCEVIK